MCLGSWASRVARTSLGCSSSSSGATCSSCAESSGTGRSGAVNQRRRSVRVLAAERDLEWKPTSSRGPLVAPRPQQPSWFEAPFASRRNIMLTLAGGAAGLWGLKRATAPIKFADKPDVPFKLTGYTDLAEDDLVYFKVTPCAPGGRGDGGKACPSKDQLSTNLTAVNGQLQACMHGCNRERPAAAMHGNSKDGPIADMHGSSREDLAMQEAAGKSQLLTCMAIAKRAEAGSGMAWLASASMNSHHPCVCLSKGMLKTRIKSWEIRSHLKL
eukprot:364843-Chlamydomonas_euryale.AAC.5